MRLVGGKVVPETFEVDSLSAFHQFLRCRSIEAKVPNGGTVVHGFPPSDTGQKCVHDDQLFGLRWELRGIGVGHH